MKDTVIETKELLKEYRGRAAVKELNLNIRQGEIYGFLGPNGAGKTTTIRMLLGLIKPTSGSIEIFGRELRRNKLQILRKVGSLVESPSYYGHLSALDNLEAIRRILDVPKPRIAEVLDIVSLTGEEKRPVKGFSLGMKQRLGIAAALLGSPELLILDEPTNGLDPAGIREMRDYMRKIAEVEGIAILISSHMLAEIEQICHRAVVIQNGKLVTVTRIAEAAEARSEVSLAIRVDKVEQARTVAGALQGVQVTGTDEAHSELHVSLPDGTVPELVAALSEAKVGVYRITENKQSLEDDFLKWTGGNRIA